MSKHSKTKPSEKYGDEAAMFIVCVPHVTARPTWRNQIVGQLKIHFAEYGRCIIGVRGIPMSALGLFVAPMCMPRGCSRDAQKLSRLSPSECPRFIRL